MEQRAIDTTYLTRCIGTLERALDTLGDHDGDDALYDLCRAACVKEFELVLEQSGKLLRKRLRPWFASNRQADRLTFRDLFRHAAKHGLLPADACERWLKYRDNRNDTAHDDGDGFAKATLELLPGFIADAKTLAAVISSTAWEMRDAPRANAQAAGTPLHLSARHRSIIEALLSKHLPDVEAWAYGSRVNGQSHDGSDLDLVLRGPGLTKIDALRYGDFIEAVGESTIPFLVEAHDWASLPERFHRQIGRDYAVLVEADRSLPVVWPEKRIEEIAEKVAMGPFGSSIRVNTFVPEGIPIISGQHLHGVRVDDSPGFNFITEEHADRLKSANVQRGDIILTHRGTIGQVAYVPRNSAYERYVASQSQFYLRCDRRQVIPQFIAYYFKTHEGQHKLLANTSQVGVPSIAQPVSYLRSIRIPVPSLDEQRAIVHVLETLEDKIELNRRMNDTLEAMVRALFKSWFVDFDPVCAKQEGRDTGLPRNLSGLFPDRIVDAGCEVPLGWTKGTLSDIASINRDAWSTKRHPDTLSYVDLSNVKWGSLDKIETFVWNDAPSRARRILRRRDTIMATVRPGNGSFALIGQDGLTGSTGFAALSPLRPSDQALIWCTATSAENLERLSRLADGAAYPAVRPKDIASTSVTLADVAVREAFSSIVDPLLDRVETNSEECRRLAAIRDEILPALIPVTARASAAARESRRKPVSVGDRSMTEGGNG